MSTRYVLSIGAGVNSTALLIYLVKNKYPLDEVIFADTGVELPETYKIVNYVEQWCKGNNIMFTRVAWLNLKDYCQNKKIIPSRRFRWCTAKFKKNPIYKHLKQYDEIYCYMGIASDEVHRAKPSGKKNINNLFPLVEKRISRNGCINIIKKAGWPMPVKSGCFFCPFQTIKAWRELYFNNPELYEQAARLEENNSAFPKFIFQNMPLRNLKVNFGEGSSKLEEYCYPPQCDSGYCMV